LGDSNLPSSEDASTAECAAVYGDSTSIANGANGAESGAEFHENALADPRLTGIVDAWPMLPQSVQAAILAMLDAMGVQTWAELPEPIRAGVLVMVKAAGVTSGGE
jgi:hypothetical protein